jgi:lipopolysaccharide transport system ATP-binding protein
MSDVVIRAENLGKKYLIGHQAQSGGYVALRDVLAQNARTFWHKTRDLVGGRPIVLGDTIEEIWALKGVDFEIRCGEAVGIIGRNGAGKSTLLKILSRITEPSAGRVTIIGRVASLLEVGTGFHPELTGRENIYLNGAILGMTRAEIRRKFDEIVAFAEIEKFLDTPVKRYSSGMYVRLAFAVAAHLEPEILVIDEVLAVGDAAFQEKCLGKMGEAARDGLTILFVSHNMNLIRQLCQRAIVFDQGKIQMDGAVSTSISRYIQHGLDGNGIWRRTRLVSEKTGIYFEELSIRNSVGEIRSKIGGNELFTINVTINVVETISNVEIALRVINQEGTIVFTTTTSDYPRVWRSFSRGQHRLRVHMSSDFFYPGRYSLHIASLIPRALLDSIDSEISFEVDSLNNLVTDIGDGRLGLISPVFEWEPL